MNPVQTGPVRSAKTPLQLKKPYAAGWKRILKTSAKNAIVHKLTEGHPRMQIKLRAALERRVELPVWDIGEDLDKHYDYGKISHDIVDLLPGVDALGTG